MKPTWPAALERSGVRYALSTMEYAIDEDDDGWYAAYVSPNDQWWFSVVKK